MFNKDVEHINENLEKKLSSIYGLRSASRVNFEDNSSYVSLLESLGNPHLKIPKAIHVAGTNGKGSTLAFLEEMMRQSGKVCHKYTSPHLLKFNERIVISGNEITDKQLEQALDYVLDVNGKRECSLFEIITALAFYVFAENEADYCLLETGLGGRLDCTNHIKEAAATIIGNIGLDHTEFLGNSVKEIAGEKAAIMKNGSPCIVSRQEDDMKDIVEEVISDMAAKMKVDTLFFDKEWFIEKDNKNRIRFIYGDVKYNLSPNIALVGEHQIYNFGSALVAFINVTGIIPSADLLVNVLNNTKWRGRMEKINYRDLPKGWELWFDGGHNENCARAISRQIDKWGGDTHLIIGMMKHKDVGDFIKIISENASSISFVNISDDGESYDADELNDIAKGKGRVYNNVDEAISNIKSNNGKNGRILVTGSFYLYKKLMG